MNADSMEYFNLNNADMNRSSEQTPPRYAHISVLMSDGRILIAGGMDENGSLLMLTELFDPHTRRKERGPQLEINRSFAAAAVLNKSAFICGGAPGWASSSYATCKRITASQLTKIQPMNERRCRFAMVAFKKRLYAFGGLGGKENTTVLSSVERYDPSKDLWSNLKPMSIARLYLAASVLGNRIYACGGGNKDWVAVHSCERYDPAENKWEAIANMTKARMGHCLVTVSGRLYALGAWHYTARKSVEMYDPIEDEWSSHPPELIHARSSSSAVVLPGMYGRYAIATSMPRKTMHPIALMLSLHQGSA